MVWVYDGAGLTVYIDKVKVPANPVAMQGRPRITQYNKYNTHTRNLNEIICPYHVANSGWFNNSKNVDNVNVLFNSCVQIENQM